MITLKCVNDRLTDHFRLDEFAHHDKDGASVLLTPEFFKFVQMLEEFRNWYRRPMNITSGFRPVGYNKLVGGSPGSAHLSQLAIDFRLPNMLDFEPARREQFYQNIKVKWCAICERTDFKPQVNFYDTYVHLGVSKYRESFLDKRKVMKVYDD